MKRMLFLCFALLLIPINANAQEIPNLDIEAYCKRRSSSKFPNLQSGMYNSVRDINSMETCMYKENYYYNLLKKRWNLHNTDVKKGCINPFSSYKIINECIEAELISYNSDKIK